MNKKRPLVVLLSLAVVLSGVMPTAIYAQKNQETVDKTDVAEELDNHEQEQADEIESNLEIQSLSSFTQKSITINIDTEGTISIRDYIDYTDADIYMVTLICENNHTYRMMDYLWNVTGQVMLSTSYSDLENYMNNNKGVKWSYDDIKNSKLQVINSMRDKYITKTNTVEFYIGINRAYEDYDFWDVSVPFDEADGSVNFYAEEPVYLYNLKYSVPDYTRYYTYCVLNPDGSYYFTEDISLATIFEGSYQLDYLSNETSYGYGLMGLDGTIERESSFYIIPKETIYKIRYPMYKIDAEWVYDFDIDNIEKNKEYIIKLKLTNNNNEDLENISMYHGFGNTTEYEKGWISSNVYLEYLNVPRADSDNTGTGAVIGRLDAGESITVEMKGIIPEIANQDGIVILGAVINAVNSGNRIAMGTIYELEGGLQFKFAENTGTENQKYEVYFNGNGGNVATANKTVTNKSTYGTLPTPSRTGYTFKGWYTAKSSGSKITTNSKVSITGNQTLYAQWTANKYTVTYNANGGSVKTKSKSVTYASTYGALSIPTRSGYKFKGWYTAKSGENKITASSKVSITKNQTLYAQWAKQYKVTFDANGGSVKTKSKTVAKGYTYSTLPSPTRSKYAFKGWYTKKSGGSKITKDKKVSITKNQTLYARWTKVSVSKGKVSKLTNTSGKKAVIAIKTVSGAKGYQVEYATNKNFKNSKKKATAKTSLTLSSLTKGKTYYVRVRGYKLDSKGKKIYGTHSAAKKVKITK